MKKPNIIQNKKEVSLKSPIERFVESIVEIVAEYEKNKMRERQHAGISSLKNRKERG